MDANTIIFLVQAVLIAGLSGYVWLGTQDEENVSTIHWVALFALVLLVIGFFVTLFFNPMAFR